MGKYATLKMDEEKARFPEPGFSHSEGILKKILEATRIRNSVEPKTEPASANPPYQEKKKRTLSLHIFLAINHRKICGLQAKFSKCVFGGGTQIQAFQLPISKHLKLNTNHLFSMH
jgi:hypothetical protein